MPISSWQAISDITAEIVRLSPKSVLDLGCGFGLYGAICRNYLDAMHGRCKPRDWTTSITGVEVHRGYENIQWDVYNQVKIGEFGPTHSCGGFDLVLMIDSLEHLESDKGAAFLDELVAYNKNVIVSVPNGPMPQGAAHGNEYERHRTTFYGHEFDKYKHTVIHKSLCIVVSIEGGKA